jgi:predicted metal-dependent phosphoesterase TrpH
VGAPTLLQATENREELKLGDDSPFLSMTNTIQVNFHCHSMFSDGDQTPEALAANLASAGVRYAALTDHDSLEGLPRFQEALKKRGVACLPGVEITTQFREREAHLLGYGLNPQDPDLAATLFSLRQVRDLDVHSIAGSLRKIGVNRPAGAEDAPAVSAAPNGRLEIGEAIGLIHRAGGRAFWAHPLLYEADLTQLDQCVAELKTKGIDGLEVIYASFSEIQRADLRYLAQKHDLLVSAGTDFHATNGVGSYTYAIEMPREAWIPLRAALFSGPTFAADNPTAEKPPSDPSHPLRESAPANPSEQPPPFQRRSYGLRIFVPTLTVIVLFLAAIWGIISAFFHHFAQNALMFKPPFRLLGNIYLSGGATEHAGEINLKDAMMPMVSFARLYALRHGINQTHTLERIEALSERGLILPSSRDEIVASYDFLMQLRLQTQIAAIQTERQPQNIIHPGRLGYIQQELLKQAFAQIAAVQKKVSYDFLGGV